VSQRRDAAVVLAMVAYVKKRLAKIEEYARDYADVSFAEEKTAGVVNGKVVSYTSRVTRRPAEPFTILDKDGFARWVGERWPTEVVMTVRPSFLTRLAEIAARYGGTLIDEAGEVCEFVKVNDPVLYTRTSLTKDAEEVLKPLLGNETLDSLPGFIEQEDHDDDER
jgi:hypothetical protein